MSELTARHTGLGVRERGPQLRGFGQTASTLVTQGSRRAAHSLRALGGCARMHSPGKAYHRSSVDAGSFVHGWIPSVRNRAWHLAHA